MNIHRTVSRLLFICLWAGLTAMQAQSVSLHGEMYSQRMREYLDVSGSMESAFFTSIPGNDSRQLTDSLKKWYPLLTAADQRRADVILRQYDYFPKIGRKSAESSSDSLFNVSPSEKVQEEHSGGLLNFFFKNPHHFYTYKSRDFSIIIDPLVDISGGMSFEDYPNPYNNTRGLRLSGYIDQKIYFFSQILENQTGFPRHVDEYIDFYSAVPGNGFYKDFDSRILSRQPAYDYLNASGYLGVPLSKSFAVEMGHGRHFIGNGFRSLLLSDFSNNYFYLKLNTRVWKLHYQNIFAELSALGNRDVSGDFLLPKKYMAAHYLAFKPTKFMEIGLFESIVFSRENHFEFQYLNPLIFYRSIEQSLGSPDNALLGLNVNVRPGANTLLYFQLVVDEFKFSEFFTDWWGNKIGHQTGIKAFDAFGLEGLDLRLEYNSVRPYTYAQSRPIEGAGAFTVSNYSHYKQALAHPLGANFGEVLLQAEYNPGEKWSFGATALFFSKGQDSDSVSYGGNILLNTDLRASDYENTNLQGDLEQTILLGGRVSYRFAPNAFIDLNILGRRSIRESGREANQLNISAGVRYQLNPSNFYF